jgi:Nineteen complex-related protein 2
MVKFLRNQ